MGHYGHRATQRRRTQRSRRDAVAQAQLMVLDLRTLPCASPFPTKCSTSNSRSSRREFHLFIDTMAIVSESAYVATSEFHVAQNFATRANVSTASCDVV